MLGWSVGVHVARVFVGGAWPDTPVAVLAEVLLFALVVVLVVMEARESDRQLAWWLAVMVVGSGCLGISYQCHIQGFDWAEGVARSLGSAAFLGALLAFLAERWMDQANPQ